jgi:oligopeptidase A
MQHILEKGGSEEPMELFKNFRGREPRVDALLRHSGISA